MSPWIFLLALLVALVVLAFARKQRVRRRDVSQQEYYDSLNRLGFQSLQEYRRSELWRETKRRYRSSDYPQRCLICGSRDFDLHHRSYSRLGDEELFDLVPLCRRHHDQLHELLDPNPKLCVKDTHDYLVFLMGNEEGPDIESEVAMSQARARACPAENGHDPGAPADSNNSRPTRAGEPWDEDEDQRLAHAFHAGEPFSQIAETHQRSRGAIVSRLVRLGYIQRKSSTNTDSPLPSQNTEHPHDKWWRKERPQAGKPWTPEEDAELRNYAASGLATEEIARRLRRGEHGVDVRLSKLGLHSDSKCGADSEDLPY